MSQTRRSCRIRNLKKGNEILQQNKIIEKHKRDSIQITTKEKRVRNKKEIIKTQQTNIVERTGTVRNSKTTNNVGRNIIFFRNKNLATKQDNVPQQKVITLSDDPT